MKKTTWVILFFFAAISIVAIWAVLADSEQTASIPTTQSPLHASEIQSNTVSTVKNKEAAPESDLKDEFNAYENEVLKASLQQVADIYEQSIKYPIGSQPITHPDQVKDYEPFEQAEVDIPFPEGDDDQNPIRVLASTNAFQYFQGDTVLARVQIVGSPKDTFIGVQGIMSGSNGDLPLEVQFQATDQRLTQFTAQFDTKLVAAKLLTEEMVLKLKVSVDQRDLATTVAFRVSVASAQLIDLLPAQPQGPELVIPLQLNVIQPGYYFVNAVLADGSNGRPLIQLQSEGRLNSGNALLNLKAHVSALKQQQSEGPYTLRSVSLYRGAEVGERFDVRGSLTRPQFAVQGFPFSVYEEQDFVDELAQERLSFLRHVGSVNEELALEQERLTQEQLTQEQESLAIGQQSLVE